MLRASAAVRLDVLRRVLRAHGHGDPHITLAEGAVWSDPETDGRADDEAWQSFSKAGLHNGNDDELDWLPVLARPEVEYYGWITEGTATTAILAASNGDNAVVANRKGHGVYLAPADAARLPEALIEYLPRARPGHGQSINVPRGARPAGFAELAAQERTGAGELYVAVRDRMTGIRTSNRHPIGYQDTTTGRWLIQVVPGHGQEWITATPATTDLLLTRLKATHQQLKRE